MAREELNSQVIIINEHQCQYSTVTLMMPRAVGQDILEESVKPILITIPKSVLIMIKQAISSTNLSAITSIL